MKMVKDPYVAPDYMVLATQQVKVDKDSDGLQKVVVVSTYLRDPETIESDELLDDPIRDWVGKDTDGSHWLEA